MFFIKIFVDEPNIISNQLVDEMIWGEKYKPISSFGVFEDLTSSLNIDPLESSIRLIQKKGLFLLSINHVIKAEAWRFYRDYSQQR